MNINIFNQLNSKNADFWVGTSTDYFHYMWALDDDMIFSIEYIPCNFPSLTCMCVSTESYLENIEEVDWIMGGRTIEYFRKLINKKREKRNDRGNRKTIGIS